MKAKNLKNKSNFFLGKLRVVFLEMMDNGISSFNFYRENGGKSQRI